MNNPLDAAEKAKEIARCLSHIELADLKQAVDLVIEGYPRCRQGEPTTIYFGTYTCLCIRKAYRHVNALFSALQVDAAESAYRLFNEGPQGMPKWWSRTDKPYLEERMQALRDFRAFLETYDAVYQGTAGACAEGADRALRSCGPHGDRC